MDNSRECATIKKSIRKESLDNFDFSLLVHVFYRELGSGQRTKSFLISHENLSILVLKVS